MSRGRQKDRMAFTWFGAKWRCADVVWRALGDVSLYCEPFAGSLAVLLSRPDDHENRRSIVGDLDGFVANFWRAAKFAPEELARHLDYIRSSVDLMARQNYLIDVQSSLLEKLTADPEFCDPKIAGWWCWTRNLWFGSDFLREDLQSITFRVPRISKIGTLRVKNLSTFTKELNSILEESTILCESWIQTIDYTASHTRWNKRFSKDPIGLFLDPPYNPKLHNNRSYKGSRTNEKSISSECRRTIVAFVEEHPNVRAVVAGYVGEHDEMVPDSWQRIRWKAPKGMARADSKRREEETLWLSPACSRLSEDGSRVLGFKVKKKVQRSA